MNDLIARLEAATGPNRELDLECWWWCKANHDGTRAMDPQYKADNLRMDDAPHYTSSIDAAITLIPEGWKVANLGQNDDGYWWCELRKPYITSFSKDGVVLSPMRCRSVAIALCIAALRARNRLSGIAP